MIPPSSLFIVKLSIPSKIGTIKNVFFMALIINYVSKICFFNVIKNQKDKYINCHLFNVGLITGN